MEENINSSYIFSYCFRIFHGVRKLWEMLGKINKKMNLQLHKSENQKIDSEIIISGSKSESNRLLILQQLFPEIKIS